MVATTIVNKEKDVLASVKHVGGALRISTEKTDATGKKVNIEKTLMNHKEKMLKVFEERGWTYNLYEEVISGTTELEKRPELQRMIADITQYDAIVCMEITRLSRQGLTSQKIKYECKKNGILIITLNPFKVYDMRNPQDVFLFDLTINMGEYEQGIVSLRVKQNKISMAHQGLNSSGSVPFGYVRNAKTKKLEIETEIDEDGNEVESKKASIVRMIYKWYLDGEGQRTICDKLNDMGIKNNKGGQWVPNSIRYLLSCPTYKGTLVANNYENEKGKMVVTETVEKHNNHPAIIDVETWDKAMQLRNNKRDRSGVDQRSNDWNSKKHMNMLDGLVFCACCGRKSTIKHIHNKGRKPTFQIIKCTRFDASGKSCINGGINIKKVQKVVLEDILREKTKIEDRISKFSSNDFEERFDELKTQKELYEEQLQELEIEMNVIYKMEMQYEMQVAKTEKRDERKEQMIEQSKDENDLKRLRVAEKLGEVTQKLVETPSAEEEIKNLKEKLDIIHELENNEDLTHHQVNALLKQILLKVVYKRDLPPKANKLSPKERDENYPPTIEIEYLD